MTNNIERTRQGVLYAWREALILIPVIIWNSVAMSFINKLYPFDYKKSIISKIVYAIIVTIIIVIIYISFFSGKNDFKKNEE